MPCSLSCTDTGRFKKGCKINESRLYCACAIHIPSFQEKEIHIHSFQTCWMYHKHCLPSANSTRGLVGYSSFMAVISRSTQLIAKASHKNISLYILYTTNTITVQCYINILSVLNGSIGPVLCFLAAWIKDWLMF